MVILWGKYSRKFSLGHILPHKSVKIWYTTVTIIKKPKKNPHKYVENHMELLVKAISSVLDESLHFCDHPTPYPRILHFFAGIFTYISKQIPRATIKNGKSITRLNYMDSLYAKLCNVKKEKQEKNVGIGHFHRDTICHTKPINCMNSSRQYSNDWNTSGDIPIYQPFKNMCQRILTNGGVVQLVLRGEWWGLDLLQLGKCRKCDNAKWQHTFFFLDLMRRAWMI